jgi:hypothetical protein
MTKRKDHLIIPGIQNSTSTGEVDELAVVQQPPPPMQSRTFNRNDIVSTESRNQHSNHFTPHDNK